MIALENRLHTAAELLELATEELMKRAPDAPMRFRFDDRVEAVASDRWRHESAGQTAMLTMCRMLEAGEIVPRGPFGTPTLIEAMPDMVERSCALDRADAGLYLAALGIAVEDAQQAEPIAPEQKAQPPKTQRWQEDEILRVLRGLGYDPKALPRNPPGSPGAKAQARAQLTFTSKVFDKAWERLRQFGDIADAP